MGKAKSGRHGLTHLDAAGQPAMVDVSDKQVTARAAVAESRVRFPLEVARQLRADALRSAKGGVVDTAVIAGTMAVKRTHELIPFCHPLPIDGCRITVEWAGGCYDIPRYCPHAGEDLSVGAVIRDGQVHCLAHNFAFDLATGSCVNARAANLTSRRVS